MKRTFIAIKISLSKETLEVINEIKTALKDERIKWVENQNLHLTLFFLGDTDEDNIKHIAEKIYQALKDNKKFKLMFREIGVFKNIYNPKVIWMGIRQSEELNVLKSKIDGIMNVFGYWVEDKKFKPHLTLGRMKFLKNKNILKEILEKYKQKDFEQIEIDEILFYESILTPQGPIYKVLEKFSLN